MVTGLQDAERARLVSVLATMPRPTTAADAYNQTRETLIAIVGKPARRLPTQVNVEEIIDDWEGDDNTPASYPSVISGHEHCGVLKDCPAFFKLYAYAEIDKKMLTSFNEVKPEDLHTAEKAIMPMLRFFEFACEKVAEVAPALKFTDT